jgi:hypothetical protein
MRKAGTGAVESVRARTPPAEDSLRLLWPKPGHVAVKGEAAVTILKRLALAILHAFGEAEAQLMGKAVILTDGTAGTVETIWLDDFHGLRVSIRGHPGKRPVAAVKFAQS